MTAQREEKAWGFRWILRKDSTHETSILHVKRDHRCSWHRHATKWNLFAVVSGEFAVVTTEDGVRPLGPGMTFSVAPGQWHEFRAYSDAVVIEEMYVSYDADDIERQNQGGALGAAQEVQSV